MLRLSTPGFHREISPFLLRTQVKRAGLTEEELRELL